MSTYQPLRVVPPLAPPRPASVRFVRPARRSVRPATEGSKSFLVTLLLSYFLGFFGADRFYLGKNRSALLKIFTLGGFGYWVVIDILMTLFGGQRDIWGLRLSGYDRYKKTAWIVIGAIFSSTVFISIVAATVMATFGGEGLAALGSALLVILGVAVTLGGTIWLLRRLNARGGTARAIRQADPVPQRIRALIQKLMVIRQQYLVHEKAGDKMAPAVIGQVDSLVANVTELFRRLQVTADMAQPARAQIEYEGKLRKLVATLDRDYLLDVLANPGLWDNPEQRMREAQGAIESVNAQLLESIRQVNAHVGLVFEFTLDGLAGPHEAMADWQRDFDEASGQGR
ncbi:TM2 domain-containing protein [Homoserinimonas sp. OAct 916]|uniref:TM2 domain-containing protein n=1 Tax=Homoserinimonas sp. OAct 916 TaxID=2211450 RepID=UPI000DBE7384|nr:TM2 domain-containing protein [Homoserinimonas sp. OAct 916]